MTCSMNQNGLKKQPPDMPGRYSMFTAQCIGDIVLSTSQTATSKFIRASTHGPYSHAAIVSPGNVLVEAYREFGVVKTFLPRVAVQDVSKVRVLRLRESKYPDWRRIGETAGETALSTIFNKYSVRNILRGIRNQDPLPAEYFCSMLVAHCYEKAGIRLLNKPLARIYPSDFLHATDHLCDKTDEVLVETAALPLPIDLYDVEVEHDWAKKAASVHHEFVAKVNPTLRAMQINPLIEFDDWIGRLYHASDQARQQLDSLFFRTMVDVGYFQLLDWFSAQYDTASRMARSLEPLLASNELDVEELNGMRRLYSDIAESQGVELAAMKSWHGTFRRAANRTGYAVVTAVAQDYARRIAALEDSIAGYGRCVDLIDAHLRR